MKCISIRQPWAGLIIRGMPDGDKKNVENRGDYFPDKHRGPLLIHAALKVEKDVIVKLNLPPEFAMPHGCIIGIVEVVDITYERTSHWHKVGAKGIYMINPVPLDHPVAYRGQLGIFEVPDSVIGQARKKGH